MENFYIYINFYNKQKIKENDILFLGNEAEKSECIYSFAINKDNIYIYHIIFKIHKSLHDKKNYSFEFEIDDYNYVIYFEGKGKTFIFDANLQMRKKMLNIYKEINIKNREYDKKLEFFINALEQSGEKDKINILYKDAIDLYFQDKNFSFLISLFTRLYQNKDLCLSLLNKFKNISIELHKKLSKKVMDRKSDLEKYKSTFIEVASKAKQLIEKNDYDIIDLYGIILCYENFYDYNYFLLIVDSLYNEMPEILYEILIIYDIQFINPINQKNEFLYNYFYYLTVNKKLFPFENTLIYFQDLENFIYILEKCKEIIYNKILSNNSENVDNYIIKVNNNLKLKKITNSKGKNVNEKTFTKLELIENIESIINFSLEKNIFFIHFTNDFWKELLYYYKEPKINNIFICFQLRKVFLSYHQLVNRMTKKISIKSEANYFFDVDEFAFLLDKMIKIYILKNYNFISNVKKLALISEYNPYYIESNYIFKIEPNFLDLFDFNNIVNDNKFIETFKSMHFELKLKDKINEYIENLLSRIRTIPDFNIINLISIEKIENKNEFLFHLNTKYSQVIKNEINSLAGIKLNENIKIIANLALINYFYENNVNKFDFMKFRIKKLPEDIILSIYTEIFKIIINKELKKEVFQISSKRLDKKDITFTLYYNNHQENENGTDYKNKFDYKELKEFSIDYIINNIKNKRDIDNIINLMNLYEINSNNEQNKKFINEFSEKILKNNSFTKAEFFSRNKNIKIELLYELYKNKKIKNYNLEQIKNTLLILNDIKRDLDGNIYQKNTSRIFVE